MGHAYNMSTRHQSSVPLFCLAGSFQLCICPFGAVIISTAGLDAFNIRSYITHLRSKVARQNRYIQIYIHIYTHTLYIYMICMMYMDIYIPWIVGGSVAVKLALYVFCLILFSLCYSTNPPQNTAQINMTKIYMLNEATHNYISAMR